MNRVIGVDFILDKKKMDKYINRRIMKSEDEYPNDEWKWLVKYLYEYSIHKNITQQQIAQKIGIERSNVCRIFSAKYKPSFPLILNIANALGLKMTFEEIEKY